MANNSKLNVLRILTYYRYFCTFPVDIINIFDGDKRFYKTVPLKSPSYFLPAIVYILIMSLSTTKIIEDAFITKKIAPLIIKLFKVLVTLGCISLCYKTRFKLAETLTLIEDFDVILRGFNIVPSFTMIRSFLILKLWTVIFITLTNNVLCVGLKEDYAICAFHFGTYNVPYIINSLIMLQFSLFVFAAWERLKIINSLLSDIVSRNLLNQKHILQMSDVSLNLKSPEMILKQVADLQNRIFNIIELINKIHSEMVLMTIVKTFIEILNGFNSFLRKENYLLIYYDSFWAAVAVIEVVLIVIPCSAAQRIARRGPNILNMLATENNERLNFELSMYCLQTLHHKITFTANGFFVLDETIFVKMLGTVASYLIILMQFSKTDFSQV